MGSTLSLVLLGAAIVVVLCAVGAWLAISRPAQLQHRRQRAEALAAAQRYTPATRVMPYGAAPPPTAPGTTGPSNGERVQAMRALLQRGDPESEHAAYTFSAEEPGREDLDSTTPMAWNPTLPPDDAEEWHFRRRDRNGAPTTGHGHITLF